ncbi:hypothetical protein [Rothia sp. 32237D007AR]
MENPTLSEINRFRIISSKYTDRLEHERPEDISEVNNIPIEEINTDIIKRIFKRLGFSHGGGIWVKASLTRSPKNIVIKIENYEIATHPNFNNFAENNEVKTIVLPIKIDAFFYPNWPGVERCKLSAKTSDILDNFKYDMFGKKKYESDITQFEHYFRGRGPYINRENYYKTLRKLNLPITYDIEILERICKEYADDPLNLPHEINYTHLVELAKYIEINNLYESDSDRNSFRDIFNIYKKYGNLSVNAEDQTLQEVFDSYSKHYEETYTKKVDLSRRLSHWLDFLTLENISTWLKRILVLSPAIFGFCTVLVFASLIQSTGGNLNFAFSLYSSLRDEIFSRILFFAALGCTVFLYIGFLYIIVGIPFNALLKKFLRTFIIINPSNMAKIFKAAFFIILTILGFLAVIHTSSIQSIHGLILFPIALIILTITLLASFRTGINIFYAPKNVIICAIVLGIIFQTSVTFSNPSTLQSQSCAYKVIDGKVYKYRYFETGNWSEKIEIALLPGSSEKWIDGSELQIPTKLTIAKTDMRSMISCTDKFERWDEAENYFKHIEKSSTD